MNILLNAIVGSQAYGTSTKNSDVDYKSVFNASIAELFGINYVDQKDYSKDNTSFELKKFLNLLQSANPTALELLFSPQDCIVSKANCFDLILNKRNEFLTKQCQHSFGGYAIAQIRKARGLDKKMNWEGQKLEKKEPIEFCYIIVDGKTYKFTEFLKSERLTENQIGLVGLDHAPHCYAVYASWNNQYKGVFAKNSDFVVTSSVSKGEKDIGTLVYNRDSFKRHSKEWGDYQTWLVERNTQRYVDNIGHNQKIDGKNLLHVRRLLDMALEIPDKGLIIRRPNSEYLLKIRRGEVNLDDIIKKAEEDIVKLDDIYKKSDLPDSAPEIESILLNIRYSCLKKSL